MVQDGMWYGMSWYDSTHLADSTVLAKDVVHLVRGNLKREISEREPKIGAANILSGEGWEGQGGEFYVLMQVLYDVSMCVRYPAYIRANMKQFVHGHTS